MQDAKHYWPATTSAPQTAPDTMACVVEVCYRCAKSRDESSAELTALDDLPNIEVRLFNPFTLRRPKLLSFTFDFFRLNRRMHNKFFTADGAATVVGGRNVSDIYFAFGPDERYIDTDELALDPAAADVSAAFDAYWNSASAYPADLILPAAPDGMVRLQAAVASAKASSLAGPYVAAVSQSPLIRTLMAGPDAVDWVKVTLVMDDPGKGLGQQGAGGLLIERLAAILTDQATGPVASLDLISAYFVPGRSGTELLTGLAARSVVVRVLINAQEATDVRMLGLAVAGIVMGNPLITQLRLSGILCRHQVSRAAGASSGCFLRSAWRCRTVWQWLSTSRTPAGSLFLSGSLMPMQDRPGAVLKYGHGAALGVIAAILIELAGTPDALRLLLALAAFVLGLRFMPHPLPISSAAMTAGVLLGSAPTPGDATFRAEAILLVIALILFLTLILDRVVPKLPETRASGQAHRDG